MMNPPREDQLKEALALAAVAQARLAVFAQKASVQGRTREAALFAALAASAGVHVRRFTMLLRGKVGDTADNLAEAAGGMLPDLLGRYAELVAAADQAGDSVAGSALDQAAQVLSRQVELAGAAEGGPAEGEPYLLCPVCGWLALGQAPDNCPVCGCIAAKFQPMEPAA
jgi:rubrerythrin